MNINRHVLETATLVVTAILCALTANFLGGREKALPLPGNYPRAMQAPARPSTEAVAASPSPSALPAVPSSTVSPAPTSDPSPAPIPAPANTPVSGKAARGPAAAGAPAALPRSEPTPAAMASEADLLSRFPAHGKPYLEIGGDQVAWLHRNGALFLDARRSNDYRLGHIKGARSVPVWEALLGERITELLNEGRKQELPVVIYCSGGDCEDSHMLAEKLFGTGFVNLLVYKDGWPDWKSRGGLASTGSEP